MEAHFYEKTYEANAIYSDNKIILFLKKKCVINVGKIKNDTDELEIEYLIQSEESTYSSFDLKKIFCAIKDFGYNYFKNKIITNDQINVKIDHITIKAKI